MVGRADLQKQIDSAHLSFSTVGGFPPLLPHCTRPSGGGNEPKKQLCRDEGGAAKNDGKLESRRPPKRSVGGR